MLRYQFISELFKSFNTILMSKHVTQYVFMKNVKKIVVILILPIGRIDNKTKTRASGYTRGNIRCLRGSSIPP